MTPICFQRKRNSELRWVYPQRLAELDPEGFLLPQAKTRICLLTGQSSFTSSALPADKLTFLSAVTSAEAVLTPTGFPWHDSLSKQQSRAPGLFGASLRNVQQVIWVRYNKDFRNALSAIVGTLLERTEERLLLVTGSCGVDLLSHALSLLPTGGPQIWALILGPTGRLPADGRITRSLVIQGHRDIWSRLLWRGPVHVRPDCGHLDYYRNCDVITAASAFFAETGREK